MRHTANAVRYAAKGGRGEGRSSAIMFVTPLEDAVKAAACVAWAPARTWLIARLLPELVNLTHPHDRNITILWRCVPIVCFDINVCFYIVRRSCAIIMELHALSNGMCVTYVTRT